MIPVIKQAEYIRPSDHIDPKDKALKPYSLDFSKFIYGNYLNGSTGVKISDLGMIQRNRSYAEGRQSSDIYKKEFLSDVEEGPSFPVVAEDGTTSLNKKTREGYLIVNFEDIFSPVPKFMMNIVSAIQSQSHGIEAVGEDEHSGTLREEMKLKMLVKKDLKKTYEQVDKIMNIPTQDNEEIIPESIDELNLFEDMGMFKLSYEEAIEKGIKHTEYISQQKEIEKKQIFDLASIGMTAEITFNDTDHGKVTNEWLDVVDLIIEDSKHNDFRDSTYFGVIKWRNLTDIMMDTDWTKEEYEEIGEQFQGEYGNEKIYSEKSNFRIPVLRCFWKTVDTEYHTQKKGSKVYYEKYRNINGKVIPPKVHNSENKKTTSTAMRSLYKTEWIIGTEYLIYHGKDFNIPFNYRTKDVESPIHFYKLPVKPIVESIIPVEDNIEFTYLRLQNAIIKSSPSGIKIEVGCLENITYGGKILDPMDVIQLYSHTGNFLYRLQPSGGAPGTPKPMNSGKPIEELRGGLGTAITDAIQSMQFFYEQLFMLSGVDPVTSAQQAPQPGQGKAVTEMAIAATSNTLKPIHSAYLWMREKAAVCAAWKIQAGIGEGVDTNPYYKVIGAGSVMALQAAGKYPPVEFGIKLIAKPNNFQKNEILATARTMLAGGKNGNAALTASEYFFVVRCVTNDVSLKSIEMWLAKKEKESMKRDKEIADNTQRLMGEEARKKDLEKHDQMITEIDAKSTAKINEIGAEENKELKIEKEKGRILIEVEELKHENKLAELQLSTN